MRPDSFRHVVEMRGVPRISSPRHPVAARLELDSMDTLPDNAHIRTAVRPRKVPQESVLATQSLGSCDIASHPTDTAAAPRSDRRVHKRRNLGKATAQRWQTPIRPTFSARRQTSVRYQTPAFRQTSARRTREPRS